MSKTEFQELLAQVCAHMHDLTATKGEEYSRDEDQLANFKRAAVEAGITPQQAWLVFFNKHLDSIKTWVRGGTLSESIESRIDDALLYLILLRAIVKDGKS